MLLRGLQVLETFTPEQPALTMVEVAERAGIHRAAARRYLLILTDLGYLRTEPGPSAYGSPRWRLTPRALRLGYSCLASLDVWKVVDPYVGDVARDTGLAAAAHVLDDRDSVCVAGAPLEGVLTVDTPPGTRRPAPSTPAGRVLLAGRSPADLDAWLAADEPGPLPGGPDRFRDTEPLRTQLKEAAVQQHDAADGEPEPGLWSVAVPVRQGDQVVAALEVTGHAGIPLGDPERERHVLATLRHTAALIGDAGATHPSGLWRGTVARLRRPPRPQAVPQRPVPFRHASDGRR